MANGNFGEGMRVNVNCFFKVFDVTKDLSCRNKKNISDMRNKKPNISDIWTPATQLKN